MAGKKVEIKDETYRILNQTQAELWLQTQSRWTYDQILREALHSLRKDLGLAEVEEI